MRRHRETIGPNPATVTEGRWFTTNQHNRRFYVSAAGETQESASYHMHLRIKLRIFGKVRNYWT